MNMKVREGTWGRSLDYVVWRARGWAEPWEDNPYLLFTCDTSKRMKGLEARGVQNKIIQCFTTEADFEL